ncbi:hypothetical protein TIFTF001_047126 [Ficus carica]|uniref:Uncharacterized protein n=1 Tax=Ficus carica TaxID=3494 RepID=A0AA87YX35_FICCA|nr:hypothetical protein TIFTF001_047126 [Ficus carica]
MFARSAMEQRSWVWDGEAFVVVRVVWGYHWGLLCGRAGVRKKGVKKFGAIWRARAECLESQKGGRFRFAYPNPSLGLAKGKSGLVGSQEGGVRKFGIQASKPTSKP